MTTVTISPQRRMQIELTVARLQTAIDKTTDTIARMGRPPVSNAEALEIGRLMNYRRSCMVNQQRWKLYLKAGRELSHV